MSQPSDEQVGKCLSAGVMAMEEEEGTVSRKVQPGQTDVLRGCWCGSCPKLDGEMARTTWRTYNGLEGGLVDCNEHSQRWAGRGPAPSPCTLRPTTSSCSRRSTGKVADCKPQGASSRRPPALRRAQPSEPQPATIPRGLPWLCPRGARVARPHREPSCACAIPRPPIAAPPLRYRCAPARWIDGLVCGAIGSYPEDSC